MGLSYIAKKASRHLELLVFTGLWLWVAIFNVPDQGKWISYLEMLLWTGIVQLPVLLFVAFKPYLKTAFSPKQYIVIWIGFFIVMLPIVTTCCILWFPGEYKDSSIYSAAVSAFILELLLTANKIIRNQVQQVKWVKKIGLESAVLITIMLIAATLSAMAVSSMHHPVYQKPNHQFLIGFEFDLLEIMANPGTFFSFFIQFTLMYLCGYLFFMINSRLLVPKVLKKEGLVIYILCLLAIIAFLYPIVSQILILLPINQLFGDSIFATNPFVLENAFGAIAIMLLSLPVLLSFQWSRQNGQIIALEKDKTQTELDLLRQQLNPHFFFNTLNNLYALSLQQSEKTSPTILQLSELMRYVIYKGKETGVTIEQELKYIDDYIQLQQMRLIKPLKYNFTQEIANQNQIIAPLLFIVLIENAFKHAIEPAEDAAFLNLYLKCDNNRLYFKCENSFEEDNTAAKGIGLQNLDRRLQLLYPDRYTLKTSIISNTFIAELKIELL